MHALRCPASLYTEEKNETEVDSSGEEQICPAIRRASVRPGNVIRFPPVKGRAVYRLRKRLPVGVGATIR